MARKSVSYLTSIRHDVTDTGAEMAALAQDLADLCVDVDCLTPEQIRSDKREEHTESLKAIYKLSGALRKAVKAHNSAAHRLQTFF